MRFTPRMLAQWEAYKASVRDYESGLISVADFLEVHTTWSRTVEAFERECCSSSNYGAF